MPGHLEVLGALEMIDLHQLQEPPKITVIEAKKLLGRKYAHLNDDQVQDIVNTLTLIARKSLSI